MQQSHFQTEFGKRIATRLTEGLDSLPDQILARLQAARLKALAIYGEHGSLMDVKQGSLTTEKMDHNQNEGKKCH